MPVFLTMIDSILPSHPWTMNFVGSSMLNIFCNSSDEFWKENGVSWSGPSLYKIWEEKKIQKNKVKS